MFLFGRVATQNSAVIGQDLNTAADIYTVSILVEWY